MNFTNNVLEKSYDYLDSLIVSIKNSIYDVFIELVDEEEVGCFIYETQHMNDARTNNLENIDINIQYEKLPMLLGDSSTDIDLDDEVDVHNTAFILDSDQIDWDKIDWNDPRNSAYYDFHEECKECPEFLHDSDGYGTYGSNYDGGYDSY